MTKTLQDCYANALLKRGETQVPSRSGKYLTFTRKNGGCYFLGKSGALRFGQASSKSIPVPNSLKKQLQEEGGI